MYGINLLFDNKTSRRFVRLWNELQKYGSKLNDNDSTPHITLCIFENINENAMNQRIRNFAANTKKFSIQFTAVGCFPTTNDVIFIIPIVSNEMHAVYNNIFTLFKDFHYNKMDSNKARTLNLHKYFFPEVWFPHVTIATKLNASDFYQAFSIARTKFKPFSGTVEKISTINFDRGKTQNSHEIFQLGGA